MKTCRRTVVGLRQQDHNLKRCITVILRCLSLLTDTTRSVEGGRSTDGMVRGEVKRGVRAFEDRFSLLIFLLEDGRVFPSCLLICYDFECFLLLG